MDTQERSAAMACMLILAFMTCGIFPVAWIVRALVDLLWPLVKGLF